MLNQFDYRRDNRSIEEFAADILHGHKVEREIIDRYVEWVERTKGIVLDVQDNGIDNSGKLLDKASSDADYKINGHPVEVKFNNRHLNVFHLKVGQLKSYIRQGATILWVNGWETDKPVFTIVTTKDLVKISKRQVVEFAGWGGKKCYRIAAKEFSWKDFSSERYKPPVGVRYMFGGTKNNLLGGIENGTTTHKVV